MPRTDQQLEAICTHLLGGEIGNDAVELEFEEFKRLYATMTRLRASAPRLTLVKTLGNEVFAQFSDIAPQHFIITDRQPLTPERFGLVPNLVWYGEQKRPLTFIRFLGKELRRNLWPLLGVFIGSAVLMFAANSPSLYELMATLLIQSGTVFLSIYLIFTVSQSHRLAEDKRLFKVGITERYFRDDRNVTLLAILTIAITFISSMFVSLLDTNWWVTIFRAPVLTAVLKAVSTAIAIAFLFDSFLTVAGYYLGRTMDVVERDVISEILHQDFEQTYYKDQ